MHIQDIIDVLRNATRQGAEKDEPEGVRYIVISDTLANKMAAALEEKCREEEDNAFLSTTTDY